MTKLLKGVSAPPRVMITDKLRSYAAARAIMGLRVEHRQHKGLNNRAENSHGRFRVKWSGSSAHQKNSGGCFGIQGLTLVP